MRTFTDANGRTWVAATREENSPRHHGRWYLVFYVDGEPERLLGMPEVRWQTRASADRTLTTMSVFELRRRLDLVQRRLGVTAPS